jgi:4-hydroxybenzoate polyprenyltransferase
MQTGDKTGIALAVLGIGVAAVAMVIPLLFPDAAHWIWLSALVFGLILILLSAVYLVRLHWESAKGLVTAVKHRFWRRTREDRYLSSTDTDLGSAIKMMA